MSLIIECYRKLDTSSHTNIFDDLYLKRYTTEAQSKAMGTKSIKIFRQTCWWCNTQWI